MAKSRGLLFSRVKPENRTSPDIRTAGKKYAEEEGEENPGWVMEKMEKSHDTGCPVKYFSLFRAEKTLISIFIFKTGKRARTTFLRDRERAWSRVNELQFWWRGCPTSPCFTFFCLVFLTHFRRALYVIVPLFGTECARPRSSNKVFNFLCFS